MTTTSIPNRIISKINVGNLEFSELVLSLLKMLNKNINAAITMINSIMKGNLYCPNISNEL
jgi:hypothetical protein